MKFWWNCGVCHLYLRPLRLDLYFTVRVSDPGGAGPAAPRPWWRRVHFE